MAKPWYSDEHCQAPFILHRLPSIHSNSSLEKRLSNHTRLYYSRLLSTLSKPPVKTTMIAPSCKAHLRGHFTATASLLTLTLKGWSVLQVRSICWKIRCLICRAAWWSRNRSRFHCARKELYTFNVSEKGNLTSRLLRQSQNVAYDTCCRTRLVRFFQNYRSLRTPFTHTSNMVTWVQHSRPKLLRCKDKSVVDKTAMKPVQQRHARRKWATKWFPS